MFETFDHTADLGLRVRAPDLAPLFADAAAGLVSMIVENPAELRPIERRQVRLFAAGLDYLLFDWLAELLRGFERDRFLPAHVSLRIDPQGQAWQLQADLSGEPAEDARHRLDHEVKAITYHGLKVEKVANGWLAEVIVDI